ncbi:hypothetical protein LJC07_04570 [Christensenellaceae bacterium OttesenSCG-928-L17]|nr:hypothetical protein [Christensenellaceae bacterium OttesenSCG-928-L17]
MTGGMSGEEKRERLDQLRAQIVEIASLERSMEVLRSIAEKITIRIHDVPLRGKRRSDGMADSAVRLAELDKRMDEALLEISERIYVAYQIINSVPDSLDRTILQEFYIQGESWEAIAKMVDKDASTCRRRRCKALGVEVID